MNTEAKGHTPGPWESPPAKRTPYKPSLWYRRGSRDYRAGLPMNTYFTNSVTGKQIGEYMDGYRDAKAGAP